MGKGGGRVGGWAATRDFSPQGAPLNNLLKNVGIWLVIGLLLYFTYGFTHSKLRVRT